MKYVIVVDVDVRVVVVSRLGWWMVVCVEECCWKDVGIVGTQQMQRAVMCG